MGWTVNFLTDNQAAQAELRRRLRVSYAGTHNAKRRPADSKTFYTHTPYLDAFTEEAIRCARTILTLMRQAIVDTELLEYHGLKYASVILVTWGCVSDRICPAGCRGST